MAPSDQDTSIIDIEDKTMHEVWYLDKLIDELVKGRPMKKVLRKPE